MKDRFILMKFQVTILGLTLLFLSACASPSPSPEDQTGSITTNEWAVRLAPGVDPYQLAIEYGAENLGPIGTLQDTYLFKRPCKILLNENGLDPLAIDERVLWLEQQVARQQSKRSSGQSEQNANECK